jgi:epoxyqueuosine reductase
MRGCEVSRNRSESFTIRKNKNHFSGTTGDRSEAAIKRIALDAGFSAAGIGDLSAVSQSEHRFSAWLKSGYHGNMHYLSRGQETRRHPTRLLDNARSALCVALNYYTEPHPPVRESGEPESRPGNFSLYSRRGEYHRVMQSLLRDTDERLKQLLPGMRSILCVDTKPVAERSLALGSGIGWLGKNSCVISPVYGSWIFLGVILIDSALKADEPLESQCGDCTLCMDACPAGALVEPATVDARRCISYLTIEKRGDIPSERRRSMGTDLFGCDICQQVCPYNDAAKISERFLAEPECELTSMSLGELSTISNRRFERLTRASTINRCRPAGMRRNASIALENLSR